MKRSRRSGLERFRRSSKLVYGRVRQGWAWTMLVLEEMGQSTALVVTTGWSAVFRRVFAPK
jgi:hypothetical protein